MKLRTLRRIATDPIATADAWAPAVVPLVALLALLAARHYLSAWPDLWRFRRRVLPLLDRVSDGDYDAELEAVDERVDVDLEAAADALPEKTGVPLQAREFVGTIDAAPAEVRAELRLMERVWPNNLASIQFEVRDGERVHEVGSYALRPEGFVGVWQYHVRLTPTQDGRTRLWAHYERNALRQPVRHYRAEGWDADRGVREVASWFGSDERFEPSGRAVALIGSE
jgi:hypothetical protein